MQQYDIEIDPNATNTSHALILDLVGGNKRILDVGCSTGYLGAVLVDRGCSVVGIEIDPEAAAAAGSRLERVVVGDLQTMDLAAELADDAFDVVIFGDVLEHVTDPSSVLRSAQSLLHPSGSVVISIPHVAHGDVRLALLSGKWNYTNLGLLDDTHVRFYTRDTLMQLLRESGFVATDVRRTVVDLFGTELDVKPEDFDAEVIDRILEDPEALTYQFVVRAVPDDADQAVRALIEREQAQRDEVHALHRSMERARREWAAMAERADLALEQWKASQEEAARLRSELRDLQAELNAIHRTKSMRALRLPRSAYGRLRRLLAL